MTRRNRIHIVIYAACVAISLVSLAETPPTPAIDRQVSLGEPWDLQVSPDGATLLTHGSGGAFLWDAASGELLRSFLGHFGSTSAATYSPDSQTVYTASYDKRILRWDTRANSKPERVALLDEPVYSLCANPDGDRLAVGTASGNLLIVEADTKGILESIEVENGEKILAVAFSPDGSKVACGGTGEIVFVFDAVDGSFLLAAAEHKGWVYDLAFSPDGSQLAVASGSGAATILDADNGSLVSAYMHPSYARSVSFSPDGASIASASVHGSAITLPDSGEELSAFKGHRHVLRSIRFHPTESALFSIGLDGDVIRWNAETGTETSRFETMHHIEISSVNASEDGTQLALRYRRLWRTFGSSLRLYNLFDDLWIDADEDQDTDWDSSISTNGLTRIDIEADGGAIIISTKSGSALRQLNAHSSPIHSAGFIGSDTQVFTASIDGRVALYDLSALPPQNLAVQLGESAIGLSWDAVPGATGYRLYRNDSNEIASASLVTELSAQTTYLDSTADPSGSYFYWIEAILDTAPFSTGFAPPVAVSQATSVSLEPQPLGRGSPDDGIERDRYIVELTGPPLGAKYSVDQLYPNQRSTVGSVRTLSATSSPAVSQSQIDHEHYLYIKKQFEIRNSIRPSTVVSTLSASSGAALELGPKQGYLKFALNGFVEDLSSEEVKELLQLDEVVSIHKDVKLEASSENVDYNDVVNAYDVWDSGYTGEGVVVAVIDSGINYSHPDFGGCTTQEFLDKKCDKVIGGWDFVNDDPDPYDDRGHGTQSASIVGANGVVKGVAPDSQLIVYKSAGADGFFRRQISF